jgi:hypothetical protein
MKRAACLAVALISIPCAPAANAAAADPLTLVGGSGARSIAFEPCRAAASTSSSDQYGYRKGHVCAGKATGGAVTGSLTISLLNSAAHRVNLSVTYVSDRGRRLALSRDSHPVGLRRVASGPLYIWRHGLGVLRLRFDLSAGEPGSDLDGLVYIRAREGTNRQTLSIPVHVLPPDGTSVHVEPASVTLSTATSPALKTITVVVTGSALPALLAQQPAGPRTLTLSGASGRQATLTLGQFTLDSTDPYRATSTLTYSKADRGTYNGSIPLFTASPGAPRLTIGLAVGSSVVLGFGLIVVGAVLGAILVFATTRGDSRVSDILALVAAVVVAGLLMWLLVHGATWGSPADCVAAVALGAAAAIVLVGGTRLLGPEPRPQT